MDFNHKSKGNFIFLWKYRKTINNEKRRENSRYNDKSYFYATVHK